MSKSYLTARRGIAELLIVVVGVGAALAADNWRAQLSDRRVEEAYLVRLHAELDGGQRSLALHRDRLPRTLAAMDSLLAWEVDGTITPRPDLARTILNSASYDLNGRVTLLDQTYSEMLATGSLGIVRDPLVRAAITSYFHRAYRFSATIEEANGAGYRAWGVGVRSAMGTRARDWFSPAPQGQGVGVAIEPSDREAHRLLALVAPGSTWTEEVRHARSRIEEQYLELSALVDATDTLVIVLGRR